MLAVIKLGGSVVSDKSEPYTLRGELVKRIGEELRKWIAEGWRLVVVHGGGSFGHPKVKEILESGGDLKSRGWEVIRVMNEMTNKICELMGEPFAPYSTPSLWDDGLIVGPIVKALDLWVPVLQGNVVPPGRVVSGDEIVRELAEKLKPDLVLLATDVDGVYESWPPSGPPLERASPCDVRASGASGIDVTGGMRKKLEEAAKAAETSKVIIFNGTRPENFEKLLRGVKVGTEVVPCKGNV